MAKILLPPIQMDSLGALILRLGRQNCADVAVNDVAESVFLGCARFEMPPFPYRSFKLYGPSLGIRLTSERCRLGLVAF